MFGFSIRTRFDFERIDEPLRTELALSLGDNGTEISAYCKSLMGSTHLNS
jgi:hypothetical protein